MKNALTALLLTLITTVCFGRNEINYNAVITDHYGNVMVNQKIDLQFAIFEDGEDVVYEEERCWISDANGIVVFNIAEENQVGSAAFTGINWGDENFYLNIKIDTGIGLRDMGTTEYKYVPYAKQADTADTTPTNVIFTYPCYLDNNFTEFEYPSHGRFRITIEFNIQNRPTSLVLGSYFFISGRNVSDTGTIEWFNGNTRMNFTSIETFTELAPCFLGRLPVVLRGSGPDEVRDVNNKTIEGDRNEKPSGDFKFSFDIVC